MSFNSAVLENSSVIGTSTHPVAIGQRTVFGHRCQVIGARIGNLCEVGNGSILMPGAVLGDGCILGEGTLIGPGAVARDGIAVRGQQLRVGRDLQPTKGEAGVEGLARREVEGAPRPAVQRLEPLGGLVELRVLATLRVLVV